MIPLRDENPSKTIPVVNTCLILANLSVFVYQNFFVPGGAEPLILKLDIVGLIVKTLLPFMKL